jgi:hypothetical protein
VREKDR